MRALTYGLLLASAALCLLAGVLGAGVSTLFAASPGKEDGEAGRVGLAVSAVLLTAGSLSVFGAMAAAPRRDRPGVRRSFLRWGVVAAIR